MSNQNLTLNNYEEQIVYLSQKLEDAEALIEFLREEIADYKEQIQGWADYG